MIGKVKSVLLETKVKITHIRIFLITMYGSKNETVKKAGGENWFILNMALDENSADTLDCKKSNKWVL